MNRIEYCSFWIKYKDFWKAKKYFLPISSKIFKLFIDSFVIKIFRIIYRFLIQREKHIYWIH